MKVTAIKQHDANTDLFVDHPLLRIRRSIA
jgi:hypothetical protein